HKKMQGDADSSAHAPSTIHWLSETSPTCPDTSTSIWDGGGVPHAGNGSLADGFHIYGMEWSPDSIKVYYDSLLVFTLKIRRSRIRCARTVALNASQIPVCPADASRHA